MKNKIAAVTEDGIHLSSHFGMAPQYRVYIVEEGQVVAVEERNKPHHQAHPDHTSHSGHSHLDMFAPIGDCQVLLCGGMGSPAYQKALEAGLKVVLTGGEIATAVQAYLEGRVTSELRRVHNH